MEGLGSPASGGEDAFVFVPETPQEEGEREAVGQRVPTVRAWLPPWRRMVTRILRLFKRRLLWHCLGCHLRQFRALRLRQA